MQAGARTRAAAAAGLVTLAASLAVIAATPGDAYWINDEGNKALVAQRLLAPAPGEAHALAWAYQAHLVERGLQATTVNRRLATLRSLVQSTDPFAVIGAARKGIADDEIPF